MGWGAFFLVDWIAIVGLSVWAYQEEGPAAVGFVGLARLLPGALALPFGAWVADRYPRRRVITTVYALEAVMLAALTVALAADGPAPLVYVLVAVAGIVVAPYRPAHLALVPLVARSPEELVAGNVVAGLTEGAATLLGPVIAAVVLIGDEPWAVLLTALGAALCGVLSVSRIAVETDPSRSLAPQPPLSALFAGFTELRRHHDIALIIGCFVVQLFVRGLLTVLLVSIAIDLLHLGTSAVGWLGAAMGAGGIVGAMLSASQTGKRRLGRPFAVGLVLWGAPIAVIGIVPAPASAVAALVVVGIGNALLDVAGLSLLQRLGDDRVLGRVFGVLFTVGIAVCGVGSLVAPALVSWLDVRGALVLAGAVLPVLAVAVLPRLRTIDRHAVPPVMQLAALEQVSLLAPLPPVTLEKLAARSEVVDVETGTNIVLEGDRADRFFAIVSGDVEVRRAGDLVAHLESGDHFGEVGLIRDAPRNASVIAMSPVQLVSIDGDAFVAAVAANESSVLESERLARERG